MAHSLPALGYPFDALEPFIDAKTMEIHHDKHHAAYVNNLNAALESAVDLAAKPLEELIKSLNAVPENIRTAGRNNGGGHYNHTMFWDIMTPGGPKEPVGTLASEIKAAFGELAALKKQFNEAGLKRFGSGWVWLVSDASGKLEVVSSANQDNPLAEGVFPIMGNDVWEHAYYLKYQNRRADYLEAWWNVLNWEKAAERYSRTR